MHPLGKVYVSNWAESRPFLLNGGQKNTRK